jgi:hypothetical protein
MDLSKLTPKQRQAVLTMDLIALASGALLGERALRPPVRSVTLFEDEAPNGGARYEGGPKWPQ